MKGLHVAIFTGGVLRDSPGVRRALASAGLVVAADSGADTAIKFTHLPTAVVGDLDSIGPETKKILEQKNCSFIVSPAEKDQTDTELAVRYAIEHGAQRITVLGGIEGDRIDHILANIFFTSKLPVPVSFVNGPTTAWAEAGPKKVSIPGRVGDLLSLLPLTPQVSAVRTQNLQYALHGSDMSMYAALGISNVLSAPDASVEFARGLLLFVHTASVGVSDHITT
jgi:thiamine pyrophosphokinase